MSVSFTYKPAPSGLAVFMAGRRIGMILPKDGGYAYRTAGRNDRFRAWGETFATVDEVKKSIEGTD